MAQKSVLLLGSTGSVGTSTLSVIDNLPEELKITALAGGRQWEKMLEQTLRYSPEAVSLSDPSAAAKLESALQRRQLVKQPRVYAGKTGLVSMVRETEGDIVLGAISGAAGLPANIAALESGKDLALANKEALVMSGAILTQLALQNNRRILPVDSEHSAVFQSLLCGRAEEVDSIILTASGGPFRTATLEEMSRATRADALKHPTWKMGEKITIDSATLMNKALEVIEAHWLFDLPSEKIRVVVHPQSIVHSLVEFHDGSVICQLGPPDMRIPIQYALTYPQRKPLPVERVRLEEVARLEFQAPDPIRFPALRLAYEVLELGGTAPSVFNAANEVAVFAFLHDTIPFMEIIGTVERTLKKHRVVTTPDLEAILTADAWAREEASRQLPINHSRTHS